MLEELLLFLFQHNTMPLYNRYLLLFQVSIYRNILFVLYRLMYFL